MFLLVLALIPALAVAPLLTQRMYRELETRELDQIEMDNAAIQAGKRDRALLSKVSQISKALKAWDHLHHAVHLCALTPGPQQPECAAADKAAHGQLAFSFRALQVFLQTGWLSSTLALQKNGQSLGALSWATGRSKPPLEPAVCKVCGEKTGFSPVPGAEPTRLRRQRPPRAPVSCLLRLLPPTSSRGWQYRLELEKGAQ